MNKITKIIAGTIALLVMTIGLSSCSSDADVASDNLSKDSDNFKVLRRVVFYNGLTDTYILTIEGFCSLGNHDKADRISVTCKRKEGYIKDIFVKSDNTTVFVDQLDPHNVSTDHYKVVLKPSTIVPEFELR